MKRMLETAKGNGAFDLGAELMKLTNNVTCRMAMSTRCACFLSVGNFMGSRSLIQVGSIYFLFTNF